MSAVAGREDEWHAERSELVGDWKALNAIQVHIQHGGIEDPRFNPPGLEARRRTSHEVTEELQQKEKEVEEI